ncbi:SDR family NAD(P)-dependent oxidoreductase [Nisaea acidiphila]|uniref:SDR family NAD(P)-dependent oxidoreductase n=1 Tax=Nisaea acidiphila TaxID=1862145 RepID=A0A9J7AP14_9PROT|nr:SDR family NAD(P)-dependent oxidoreductase [Nisaea acidiphila]UUX49371.1 SDR family NAD(P)-dependent oxidoreductase [Nisaea acidiphila]
MTGILEGRIAVITGASRGIGAAVAKAFAREGAHVVLIARTVGALEELDDEIRAAGGSASLVPMDLKDFDAIDRLGAALYERYGKIDILVANGGMLGNLTPMHHYDPKLWEDVIAVNLTANQRLVRSLDPLLRQSDAGRAIFVTSGAAHGERPFWGAYAVSKAALEAMVRSYAAENARGTIRANLLNPGPTRTKMRATAYPGEDQATVKPPEDLVPLFLELAAPDCRRNGDLVDA